MKKYKIINKAPGRDKRGAEIYPPPMLSLSRLSLLLCLLLVAAAGCELEAERAGGDAVSGLLPDAGTPASDGTGQDPGGEDPGADPGGLVDPGSGRDGGGAGGPRGPVCRFGAYASSVYDMPFPSDALVGADGALDLSLFPLRGEGGIMDRYLDYVEREGLRWSVGTGVYFVFDLPLELTTLPEPAATTQRESPVLLVNVTEGSKRRGEMVPLLLDQWTRDDGVYYQRHTLIVHPVWGHVLEEGATYAAVVTSGLVGIDGRAVEAPESFAAALAGADGAEHSELLAPLREWASAEHPELLDSAACATVFTTGSPTAELARAADRVATMGPEEVPELNRQIEQVAEVEESTFFVRYQGSYAAPNFQRGEVPYLSNGGGFDLDEQGFPVMQRIERMDITLAVPRSPDMPEAGWPVVIHAHGTGGNHTNHFTGSSGPNASPAGRLAAVGIASVGIDQPIHGTRCQAAGCDNVDLASFNLLNPESATTTLRQGALDTIFLAALLRGGATFQDRDGVEVRFDPDHVSYFGHSQGGLTGALLAAVEPQIDGYLLSAAGGGIPITIVERKDFMDLEKMVRAQLKMPGCSPGERETRGCELTPLHPALSIVQMLVDPVDPLAYAPHWTAGTYVGRPQNMLLTEGVLDAATPPLTTDVMAAAARIPVAEPVVNPVLGLELAGVDALKLPASHNLADDNGARASGVLLQLEGFGHNAVFHGQSPAIAAYQSFFGSLAKGEPALLTYSPP